jgi:hypothetical protein
MFGWMTPDNRNVSFADGNGALQPDAGRFVVSGGNLSFGN